MKYRVYIDEVGNPDLRSSDNPNHRFLSLTGVIVEVGYVASVLHPQMEGLKALYFGSHPDEPVILHRKELVNAKDPFREMRAVWAVSWPVECEDHHAALRAGRSGCPMARQRPARAGERPPAAAGCRDACSVVRWGAGHPDPGGDRRNDRPRSAPSCLP